MSTIRLSPYINFQGRAREALAFYQSILGGSLDFQAAGEHGALKPAGPNDRIQQARLEANGVIIIASDGHPNYPPTTGDNMAIVLSGTDKDQLATIFSALAEGGQVKMPFSERPGGGANGFLADKFGITWMVTLDQA